MRINDSSLMMKTQKHVLRDKNYDSVFPNDLTDPNPA